MKQFGWVASLVVLMCLCALPSAAQDAPATGDALNLFFDCQGFGCRDMDFFRREVPIVNWVRDREVSDVHVLVTSQRTGGGGFLYTLAFIGRGDFEGEDQELTVATAGDATSDEQRRAIVGRLKLGLVRYVQDSALADQLTVTFGGGAQTGAPGRPGGGPLGGPGAQTASPEDDPWNFWVFSISARGFVNGQSTSKFTNYFGNASANRTTEQWKISLGGNYSRNVQRFEVPLSDGSTFSVNETREDWGVNSSLVKSVGGQFSLGIRVNAGSSTFLNQDFRWSVKPGAEYNFFPYEESSRRSLTLQYLVGPNHFDYTERTIFGETEETRFQESLTGRLSLVEQWGRWSTSLTGAHYMHDLDRYNLTLSGNFDIRLFRGFSIRVSGNYSWIGDQLYISAGDLTEEQILLRQRQLETNYRYFTSFGITYRFGSIFNNVVNPRFGRSGGGEFIVFG